MQDQRATGASGSLLADAAAAAGFRGVPTVTLETHGSRTVARATGVLHRYPRTVAISVATANALVAAGAPLRVVRRSSDGGTRP